MLKFRTPDPVAVFIPLKNNVLYLCFYLSIHTFGGTSCVKKILEQFNSLFKCILECDIVFNLSLRVRSSEIRNILFNK